MDKVNFYEFRVKVISDAYQIRSVVVDKGLGYGVEGCVFFFSQRCQLLSTDITCNIIFIIILDAFATEMPARYE
jgi:hypothetical protein